MTKIFYIISILSVSAAQSQTILQNTGNLRVHEEGRMGFYVDLINDGGFDENRGLVGFYGDEIRNIGGSLPPTFNDVEFMTQDGTLFGTTVNVSNNANFISGNVSTPRARPTTTLHFLMDAFSSGEANSSKVDGYASMNGQQNFTFPVGDVDQLRPLILNSDDVNAYAKCAYFLEDPNAPNNLPGTFDTDNTARGIVDVGQREFWRLEGSESSSVQLSWNERSSIASLTDDVGEVVIAGWSKRTNQWESLAGPRSIGDLSQGIAVSASFVPDDYEVLTFAALGGPREFVDLDNYMVSPNGDGINDFLEIPELEQSPNNLMMIFDRNGLKVFEQENYTDQFNGFANEGDVVIQRGDGLPSGVYFYLVSLHDLDLDFQGFLYLAKD